MDDENRGLLEDVIRTSLTSAMDGTLSEEEQKSRFKQAMDAIDRQINLNKVDFAYQENYDKTVAESKRLEEIEKLKIEIEQKRLEIEESKAQTDKIQSERDAEFQKLEARKTWIYRGIELTCTCLVAPIVAYGVNKGLSKVIMHWEEGNTFTSTPGKALRSMFQFKK